MYSWFVTCQKRCRKTVTGMHSFRVAGEAFSDFLRFSVLSQVLSLTKSKYFHLHWFACLGCFSRGLTVSNIKTASIEHKFFRCKSNIKNVNYFQDRHINTFSLFSLENCHRTKARLMAQLMYLIGLSSLLKLSLQESMLSKSQNFLYMESFQRDPNSGCRDYDVLHWPTVHLGWEEGKWPTCLSTLGLEIWGLIHIPILCCVIFKENNVSVLWNDATEVLHVLVHLLHTPRWANTVVYPM